MRDMHIMDIAMNLARIGNWAADDFDGKEKRINVFLEQTKEYLQSLDIDSYSTGTQHTLACFAKAFYMLRTQTPRISEERLRWAEDMLTWSNILTHKAKLNLP